MIAIVVLAVVIVLAAVLIPMWMPERCPRCGSRDTEEIEWPNCLMCNHCLRVFRAGEGEQ